MEILEKDLEDLIFGALGNEPSVLHSIGFKTDLMMTPNNNNVYWFRQVNLKGYGIADIIGYSRIGKSIHVDIIELKNVPLTSKDFDQVFRYKTAIEEALKNRLKGRNLYVWVNCYLVGPSIDSGHYIQNNSMITLFTFKYGLHGFIFEPHRGGWCRDGGILELGDISFSGRADSYSLTREEIEVEDEDN
jgi:hypothetical protein